MGAMASQITSLATVYSTVYSGADQIKHESSASLAFVRGIHWSLVTPFISLRNILLTSARPLIEETSLIARFMGPTWGLSGDDRTQVGPMFVPWTLLSGIVRMYHFGPTTAQICWVNLINCRHTRLIKTLNKHISCNHLENIRVSLIWLKVSQMLKAWLFKRSPILSFDILTSTPPLLVTPAVYRCLHHVVNTRFLCTRKVLKSLCIVNPCHHVLIQNVSIPIKYD